MKKKRIDKHIIGIILFIISIILSFYIRWAFYVGLVVALIIAYWPKTKDEWIAKLMLILIISIILNIVFFAVLTFGDRIDFVTGTHWKLLDNKTCEKEIRFLGTNNEACAKAIDRYQNEVISVNIAITPTTLPECFQEVCK